MLGWWLAGGCGDDEAPASAAAEPAASAEAPGTAEPGKGDALLRRAREGIREGALPDELRDEVLGSGAPAHARARRVLLAMADPPPDLAGDADAQTGAAGETHEADDARPRPPPILPPSETAALPEPEPVHEGPRSVGERSGGTPASRPASADRPVRTKGRAELGTLSLRSTKRGATLTIAAPSSLVVGVANQPASGLVRLVIESAQAGSAVLRARPRTEGAEVTGVRQGQGTVQITIRLEPGWSLGSVQPFSGGAKVHLLAPP